MNRIERDIALPAARERQAAPPASASSPSLVLAIVCVGICLANLDLFIVNVALPNIARDFNGTSLEDMSWILNGYAIAYAALLVFFGRLAERYRRDLSFLLGVGAVHRRIGGLRRRQQCRDPGRVSPGPGRRRGADDADLARPAARGISARSARRRGADLDRDRRPRRGARTGRRRPAGDRKLALDLHRQRSDRPGRHG